MSLAQQHFSHLALILFPAISHRIKKLKMNNIKLKKKIVFNAIKAVQFIPEENVDFVRKQSRALIRVKFKKQQKTLVSCLLRVQELRRQTENKPLFQQEAHKRR